jgi:hypothetical protein
MIEGVQLENNSGRESQGARLQDDWRYSASHKVNLALAKLMVEESRESVES